MTISSSKITYKTLRMFSQAGQKPQAIPSEDLSLGIGRVAVYKPHSLRKPSITYHCPASPSKVGCVRHRGFSGTMWDRYPTQIVTANPLATNMIVPGGGNVDAIETESSSTEAGVANLRQVGRVLALNYTLETLLLLTDNGATKIAQLIEELVPQDKIFKTISELHSSELVEIEDDIVSPTPKALKVSALLREKLKNTPS